MVAGGAKVTQIGQSEVDECGKNYVYDYQLANESELQANETIQYEDLTKDQKRVFKNLVEENKSGAWPEQPAKNSDRGLKRAIQYRGEYYDLKVMTSDCTPIDWFILIVGISLTAFGAVGILVTGWQLRRGWKEAQSA
jgi:hypothetical protein